MVKLTTRQINALAKKNVTDVLHLHRWFPLKYIDNTRETGAYREYDKRHVTVIGLMLEVELCKTSAGKSYVKAKVRDQMSQEVVRVMIFGAGEPACKRIERWIGKYVLVSGTLQAHPIYGLSIAGPEIFTPDIQNNMKVIPVYSKVKGISAEKLSEILESCEEYQEIDTVNPEILKLYQLKDINTAVRDVMSPESIRDMVEGKKRFVFDDLLYFAGHIQLNERHESKSGLVASSTALTESVIASLPYTLTNGQRNVYENVKAHMLKGERVKCLVQGDVSCGKTIVGFLSLIIAAENGHQAALIAPTKILAMQHYEKLTKLLASSDLRVALLTNSTTDKQTLKDIKEGVTDIVIGTHSVLSDKVEFKDLKMFIVDEEHKFGVQQRNKIEEKQNGIDYISMSATPIPRTLALTIYGNSTEVFSIKEKPGCRKPVKTFWDNGDNVTRHVKSILDIGQQIYAVCPMINEADDDSVMAGILSTTEAVNKYRRAFPDIADKIVELNGLNTAEETDDILSRFQNGDIKILVSTTVVEVGVDNPNATLMIIHNSERFGISQMHQLRGRVGRGSLQSYCMLVSKESPELNERIKTLIETDDGFEIAERDMLFMRKSGNLFGDEQSGRNKYIDEVMMYPELYDSIKQLVPQLSDAELQLHIDKIKKCEIQGHMKPISL